MRFTKNVKKMVAMALAGAMTVTLATGVQAGAAKKKKVHHLFIRR